MNHRKPVLHKIHSVSIQLIWKTFKFKLCVLNQFNSSGTKFISSSPHSIGNNIHVHVNQATSITTYSDLLCSLHIRLYHLCKTGSNAPTSARARKCVCGGGGGSTHQLVRMGSRVLHTREGHVLSTGDMVMCPPHEGGPVTRTHNAAGSPSAPRSSFCCSQIGAPEQTTRWLQTCQWLKVLMTRWLPMSR